MVAERQNRHHLRVRSRQRQSRKALLALSIALFIGGTSFVESAIGEKLRAEMALQEIQTKGRAPQTGYARDLFGSPWSDVDRNGCDTRNDVLARDLLVLSSDRCVIFEGVLIDPYSGERIEFSRGRSTSLAVQIDHVVSLSNAWQTGAFRWGSEKLRRFANDPLNLLAVKGSLNSQKGDGDAATWLPPKKS